MMLPLLKKLVNIPSCTPFDQGCQDIIATELHGQGFSTQRFNCGDVSNLWAEIGNSDGPYLVFAGHTDVVPEGDLAKWHSPPYEATEKDGKLYGRGTCDMKGAICAMIAASERFLSKYPNFKGKLGYLITSGEEGNDFIDGTPHVMEQLKSKGISIDYCIVGEPSSQQTVGDMVKVGRRGSLTAYVTIHGKQGHVAYPNQAINPIHQASPFISDITAMKFDQGNAYFQPTQLQMTNIQSGTGAGNVIPGSLTFQCNFRYSTETTKDDLIAIFEKCLFKTHQLTADIKWQHNGAPFLTKQGKLVEACVDAINLHTTVTPELSTSGGTSDGRFIAPYGVQVIELGACNDSIHQINEYTKIDELQTLSEIYETICQKMLAT